MSITKSFFDTYGGKEVYAYTLTNKGGASVTILTYGGIMSRLFVPDRDGKLADVICGFDSIADYVTDRLSYTGAIIGRYGNRIGGGGFTIGDTFYAVASNEKGRGHLHGGNVGFNRRLWDAEPIEGEGADSLVMSLFSPDGEEGYPGDLYVKVTYTFDDDNALTIRYEATSNKDTYLNMTSHTYYNLNGYDGSSVMEQELRIAADRYDVIDELFIPVGAPASVEGTIFDFREARAIANPYDHNFVLCDKAGELRFAAEYHDPASGRTMTVYTDLPAIQLYTAVGMDGPTLFKGGVPQRCLHALCLETQFSPDTPNRPYMPQCFLPAGGKYDSVTKFVFGTK
jgi:aldose 1-epimerase